MQKGEANRRIPGQISLDDLSLSKKKARLVCHGRIHYSTWITCMAALVRGCRLEIEARQDHVKWKLLATTLQDMGLHCSVNSEELDKERSTQDLEVEVHILDLEDAEMQQQLHTIYQHPQLASPTSPHLPQVITPTDGPHVRDYVGLYRTFSRPRSIAINTMRHGAPLE